MSRAGTLAAMPDHPAIAALSPAERAQWEEAKRIFCAQPDWTDKDDADILADVRARLVILRQWARLFTALGLDVAAEAADMEAKGNAFARAAANAERALEASLQATADHAEARHRLFKAADAIVTAAYEERPFDPQVQEARTFLDAWRAEFPKE